MRNEEILSLNNIINENMEAQSKNRDNGEVLAVELRAVKQQKAEQSREYEKKLLELEAQKKAEVASLAKELKETGERLRGDREKLRRQLADKDASLAQLAEAGEALKEKGTRVESAVREKEEEHERERKRMQERNVELEGEVEMLKQEVMSKNSIAQNYQKKLFRLKEATVSRFDLSGGKENSWEDKLQGLLSVARSTASGSVGGL